MKKIILTIILLLLSASFGYGQDQPLSLFIKSDKQVYRVEEEIKLWLVIKNLSSETVQAPPLVWSSIITIDGREYKLKPEETRPWNGPSAILPKGEFGTTIELAEYDIAKDILTIGKHNIAIEINGTTSNTITIKVVEKKEAIAGDNCNSDEDCLNVNCSGCDVAEVKEGYKPYCVNNKCKCMCYGCE